MEINCNDNYKSWKVRKGQHSGYGFKVLVPLLIFCIISFQIPCTNGDITLAKIGNAEIGIKADLPVFIRPAPATSDNAEAQKPIIGGDGESPSGRSGTNGESKKKKKVKKLNVTTTSLPTTIVSASTTVAAVTTIRLETTTTASSTTTRSTAAPTPALIPTTTTTPDKTTTPAIAQGGRGVLIQSEPKTTIGSTSAPTTTSQKPKKKRKKKPKTTTTTTSNPTSTPKSKPKKRRKKPKDPNKPKKLEPKSTEVEKFDYVPGDNKNAVPGEEKRTSKSPAKTTTMPKKRKKKKKLKLNVETTIKPPVLQEGSTTSKKPKRKKKKSTTTKRPTIPTITEGIREIESVTRSFKKEENRVSESFKQEEKSQIMSKTERKQKKKTTKDYQANDPTKDLEFEQTILPSESEESSSSFHKPEPATSPTVSDFKRKRKEKTFTNSPLAEYDEAAERNIAPTEFPENMPEILSIKSTPLSFQKPKPKGNDEESENTTEGTSSELLEGKDFTTASPKVKGKQNKKGKSKDQYTPEDIPDSESWESTTEKEETTNSFPSSTPIKRKSKKTQQQASDESESNFENILTESTRSQFENILTESTSIYEIYKEVSTDSTTNVSMRKSKNPMPKYIPRPNDSEEKNSLEESENTTTNFPESTMEKTRKKKVPPTRFKESDEFTTATDSTSQNEEENTTPAKLGNIRKATQRQTSETNDESEEPAFRRTMTPELDESTPESIPAKDKKGQKNQETKPKGESEERLPENSTFDIRGQTMFASKESYENIKSNEIISPIHKIKPKTPQESLEESTTMSSNFMSKRKSKKAQKSYMLNNEEDEESTETTTSSPEIKKLDQDERNETQTSQTKRMKTIPDSFETSENDDPSKSKEKIAASYESREMIPKMKKQKLKSKIEQPQDQSKTTESEPEEFLYTETPEEVSATTEFTRSATNKLKQKSKVNNVEDEFEIVTSENLYELETTSKPLKSIYRTVTDQQKMKKNNQNSNEFVSTETEMASSEIERSTSPIKKEQFKNKPQIFEEATNLESEESTTFTARKIFKAKQVTSDENSEEFTRTRAKPKPSSEETTILTPKKISRTKEFESTENSEEFTGIRAKPKSSAEESTTFTLRKISKAKEFESGENSEEVTRTKAMPISDQSITFAPRKVSKEKEPANIENSDELTRIGPRPKPSSEESTIFTPKKISKGKAFVNSDEFTRTRAESNSEESTAFTPRKIPSQGKEFESGENSEEFTGIRANPKLSAEESTTFSPRKISKGKEFESGENSDEFTKIRAKPNPISEESTTFTQRKISQEKELANIEDSEEFTRTRAKPKPTSEESTTFTPRQFSQEKELANVEDSDKFTRTRAKPKPVSEESTTFTPKNIGTGKEFESGENSEERTRTKAKPMPISEESTTFTPRKISKGRAFVSSDEFTRTRAEPNSEERTTFTPRKVPSQGKEFESTEDSDELTRAKPKPKTSTKESKTFTSRKIKGSGENSEEFTNTRATAKVKPISEESTTFTPRKIGKEKELTSNENSEEFTRIRAKSKTSTEESMTFTQRKIGKVKKLTTIENSEKFTRTRAKPKQSSEESTTFTPSKMVEEKELTSIENSKEFSRTRPTPKQSEEDLAEDQFIPKTNEKQQTSKLSKKPTNDKAEEQESNESFTTQSLKSEKPQTKKLSSLEEIEPVPIPKNKTNKLRKPLEDEIYDLKEYTTEKHKIRFKMLVTKPTSIEEIEEVESEPRSNEQHNSNRKNSVEEKTEISTEESKPKIAKVPDSVENEELEETSSTFATKSVGNNKRKPKIPAEVSNEEFLTPFEESTKKLGIQKSKILEIEQSKTSYEEITPRRKISKESVASEEEIEPVPAEQKITEPPTSYKTHKASEKFKSPVYEEYDNDARTISSEVQKQSKISNKHSKTSSEESPPINRKNAPTTEDSSENIKPEKPLLKHSKVANSEKNKAEKWRPRLFKGSDEAENSVTQSQSTQESINEKSEEMFTKRVRVNKKEPNKAKRKNKEPRDKMSIESESSIANEEFTTSEVSGEQTTQTSLPKIQPKSQENSNEILFIAKPRKESKLSPANDSKEKVDTLTESDESENLVVTTAKSPTKSKFSPAEGKNADSNENMSVEKESSMINDKFTTSDISAEQTTRRSLLKIQPKSLENSNEILSIAKPKKESKLSPANDSKKKVDTVTESDESEDLVVTTAKPPTKSKFSPSEESNEDSNENTSIGKEGFPDKVIRFKSAEVSVEQITQRSLLKIQPKSQENSNEILSIATPKKKSKLSPANDSKEKVDTITESDESENLAFTTKKALTKSKFSPIGGKNADSIENMSVESESSMINDNEAFTTSEISAEQTTRKSLSKIQPKSQENSKEIVTIAKPRKESKLSPANDSKEKMDSVTASDESEDLVVTTAKSLTKSKFSPLQAKNADSNENMSIESEISTINQKFTTSEISAEQTTRRSLPKIQPKSEENSEEMQSRFREPSKLSPANDSKENVDTNIESDESENLTFTTRKSPTKSKFSLSEAKREDSDENMSRESERVSEASVEQTTPRSFPTIQPKSQENSIEILYIAKELSTKPRKESKLSQGNGSKEKVDTVSSEPENLAAATIKPTTKSKFSSSEAKYEDSNENMSIERERFPDKVVRFTTDETSAEQTTRRSLPKIQPKSQENSNKILFIAQPKKESKLSPALKKGESVESEESKNFETTTTNYVPSRKKAIWKKSDTDQDAETETPIQLEKFKHSKMAASWESKSKADESEEEEDSKEGENMTTKRTSQELTLIRKQVSSKPKSVPEPATTIEKQSSEEEETESLENSTDLSNGEKFRSKPKFHAPEESPTPMTSEDSEETTTKSKMPKQRTLKNFLPEDDKPKGENMERFKVPKSKTFSNEKIDSEETGTETNTTDMEEVTMKPKTKNKFQTKMKSSSEEFLGEKFETETTFTPEESTSSSVKLKNLRESQKSRLLSSEVSEENASVLRKPISTRKKTLDKTTLAPDSNSSELLKFKQPKSSNEEIIPKRKSFASEESENSAKEELKPESLELFRKPEPPSSLEHQTKPSTKGEGTRISTKKLKSEEISSETELFTPEENSTTKVLNNENSKKVENFKSSDEQNTSIRKVYSSEEKEAERSIEKFPESSEIKPTKNYNQFSKKLKTEKAGESEGSEEKTQEETFDYKQPSPKGKQIKTSKEEDSSEFKNEVNEPKIDRSTTRLKPKVPKAFQEQQQDEFDLSSNESLPINRKITQPLKDSNEHEGSEEVSTRAKIDKERNQSKVQPATDFSASDESTTPVSKYRSNKNRKFEQSTQIFQDENSDSAETIPLKVQKPSKLRIKIKEDSEESSTKGMQAVKANSPIESEEETENISKFFNRRRKPTTPDNSEESTPQSVKDSSTLSYLKKYSKHKLIPKVVQASEENSVERSTSSVENQETESTTKSSRRKLTSKARMKVIENSEESGRTQEDIEPSTSKLLIQNSRESGESPVSNKEDRAEDIGESGESRASKKEKFPEISEEGERSMERFRSGPNRDTFTAKVPVQSAEESGESPVASSDNLSTTENSREYENSTGTLATTVPWFDEPREDYGESIESSYEIHEPESNPSYDYAPEEPFYQEYTPLGIPERILYPPYPSRGGEDPMDTHAKRGRLIFLNTLFPYIDSGYPDYSDSKNDIHVETVIHIVPKDPNSSKEKTPRPRVHNSHPHHKRRRRRAKRRRRKFGLSPQ